MMLALTIRRILPLPFFNLLAFWLPINFLVSSWGPHFGLSDFLFGCLALELVVLAIMWLAVWIIPSDWRARCDIIFCTALIPIIYFRDFLRELPIAIFSSFFSRGIIWLCFFAFSLAVGVYVARFKEGRRFMSIFVAGIILAQTFIGVKNIIISVERDRLAYFGEQTSNNFNGPQDIPQIIHIVVDSYPQLPFLAEHAGFNDGSLQRVLEENGYTLIPGAHSQYPNTLLSMTSTLDLKYHSNLFSGSMGKEICEQGALEGNNEFVRVTKSLGYRYIQFDNAGPVAYTRCGPNVDQCVKSDDNYRTTAWLNFLFHTPLLSALWQFWPEQFVGYPVGLDRVLAFFSEEPLPTGSYVFAHTFGLHDPLYLRATCAVMAPGYHLKDVERKSDHYFPPEFNEQLVCVNKMFVDMIEEIARRYPNALVLFHADHGKRLSDNDPLAGLQMSEAIREERFGILAAIKMPPRCKSFIQPGLSLVNISRAMLACVEGKEPEFISDQQIWFTHVPCKVSD